MKRIRKMVPLSGVVQTMLTEQSPPRMRSALWRLLVLKIFGEAVAAHIDSVWVEDRVLYIRVLSPAWEKELRRQRGLVLERAREHEPSLKRVVFEGTG